jgi:glycosyltransferase involved in cell wall biosynthesis
VRILIVTNLFPDRRLPAFGTFVASHAVAVEKLGAEVRVVSVRGIPAHRAVLRKYAWLSVRTIMSALAARLMRRPADVVEAHIAYPTALPAWVAARIMGSRLVIYCHGSDVTGDGADGVTRLVAGSPTHYRLARRVFASADLMVANSRFVANVLQARFGVDARKVAVVSPGIDFQLFFRSGASGPRQGIVYVGRLARGKGVYELLSAVSLLDPRPPMTFVGDGPERSALEAVAEAAGVEVTFLGGRQPSDVAEAMGHAAVVAVPSVYPEGLGLVALEAMAAGALVVASSVGGLAESVVAGRTGWSVPPGDIAALAAALSEALAAASGDDPLRRSAVQDRARRKARQHDAATVARQVLRHYESLTGASRA